ncbi:tyrosine-type recombinase/integrase [Nocardiopsis gilva]
MRWSKIKGICDDCGYFYDAADLFASDRNTCAKCSQTLRSELRAGWQLKHKPYRHGCDDIAACTRDRHRRPCPKDCPGHHTDRCGPECTVKSHRCPEVKRPCPPDCQGHGRECPKRRGGEFYFAPRKGVSEGRGQEKVVLPLPEPLVRELREHWRWQQHERDIAGDKWDDTWNLVFCKPDGRPIGKRADWGDWKDVLRIAEVRDARVHDGRHTAATLLSELEVDPRTIQVILGHSQISQTEQHIHASSELTRGATQKIGAALWG